VLFSLSCCF